MNFNKFIYVPILILILLFISCQKVVQESVAPGQLEKAKMENLAEIPLDYGNLISVTTHAQYEGWAQLWFVDQQSTIRMVRVQFHTNRIHEHVLVIPRN